MNKIRHIDITKCIMLKQAVEKEVNETGVIAVNYYNVHIHPDHMAEIAPIGAWKLNIKRQYDTQHPYAHRVTVNDVEFLAITEKPIELPEQVQP